MTDELAACADRGRGYSCNEDRASSPRAGSYVGERHLTLRGCRSNRGGGAFPSEIRQRGVPQEFRLWGDLAWQTLRHEAGGSIHGARGRFHYCHNRTGEVLFGRAIGHSNRHQENRPPCFRGLVSGSADYLTPATRQDTRSKIRRDQNSSCTGVFVFAEWGQGEASPIAD